MCWGERECMFEGEGGGVGMGMEVHAYVVSRPHTRTHVTMSSHLQPHEGHVVVVLIFEPRLEDQRGGQRGHQHVPQAHVQAPCIPVNVIGGGGNVSPLVG